MDAAPDEGVDLDIECACEGYHDGEVGLVELVEGEVVALEVVGDADRDDLLACLAIGES